MNAHQGLALALAALGIAACTSDPMADLRAGKAEKVEKAIRAGRLAADGADPSGKPLLLVAYEADRPAVGKALLRGGADPNVAGPSGQPLLHEVVAAGKAAWLDALAASHRLDPNVPGADGATPLLVALRRGDDAAVDALFARGASLELAGGRWVLADETIPWAPRFRLRQRLDAVSPTTAQAEAALAAARANDAAALTALLDQRPRVIDAQGSRGETILMAAVAAGAADAAHVLLDRGADLHRTWLEDGGFVTALDLAREPAMRALLRAHGARPSPERKAEVIIAAGARTAEELQPILAELRSAKFPYAPGFPAIALSDRVPGLNRGRYVVLVGTCPEGPAARAWAAAFRASVQSKAKDAYAWPVTLRTDRLACPGAREELPLLKVDAGDGTTLVAQRLEDRWPVSIELRDAKGMLLDWKLTATPADEDISACADAKLGADGHALRVDFLCCTGAGVSERRVTWSASKGKLRSQETTGRLISDECGD